MTKDAILTAIQHIAIDDFCIDDDDMKPETPLSVIVVESLDAVEFLMALEEEFGDKLVFDVDQYEHMQRTQTISDLVDYIHAKLN